MERPKERDYDAHPPASGVSSSADSVVCRACVPHERALIHVWRSLHHRRIGLLWLAGRLRRVVDSLQARSSSTTACHGPGPANYVIDGVERRFLGYAARGAPFGPDDGTIAPRTVVAALPFAPDVVLPTLHRFHNVHVRVDSRYGFDSTFNPTYPGGTGASAGWFCPWNFDIDQGAIGLMTENYWTGLLWRLMRQCPYVRTGLPLGHVQGALVNASVCSEGVMAQAHGQG